MEIIVLAIGGVANTSYIRLFKSRHTRSLGVKAPGESCVEGREERGRGGGMRH